MTVQKNAFPKHHALATGKQNKDKAIPNGKPVGGGKGCCNPK